MTLEGYISRNEHVPEIVVKPPVVESFLNPEQAAEVWPAEIANNEDFIEQTTARRELNERLDRVISRLPRPDISLETAVAEQHLEETDVANLYNSLSKMFETDSDYDRLALYLPFEFLPDIKWQPATEELRQAKEKIAETYMKAWHNLLEQYDVRANFVDGDILENGQENPRVAKATHLIPMLVKKGMMDVNEVIHLMEESTNETLKHNIADGLPVMADMGLITKTDHKRMAESNEPLVRNMEKIISAQKNKIKKPAEPITIDDIPEKLRIELSLIDEEDHSDVSKKRGAWLRREKMKLVIKNTGDAIGEAIANGNFTDSLRELFIAQETETHNKLALLEGIRVAIETTAMNDAVQAKTIYAQYEETLLTIGKTTSPTIQNALTKTYNRLLRLGVVQESVLTALNIDIPNLGNPFSENLASMEQETIAIQEMLRQIESNPELSRLIYPVLLINGSRLRGYGNRDADIDVSVLVKPGTSLDEREKLQTLLKQTFVHERIEGPFIEFWLENDGDHLKIRDFSEYDVALGEGRQMDNLFGTAWEGDIEIIRDLREKLLTPYLFESNTDPEVQKFREACLRDIERASLQYRLMHQGYEKFYPPYGGINTPHADEIDGQSVFYDSGYRSLATKLFVSRVFLPKISRPSLP